MAKDKASKRDQVADDDIEMADDANVKDSKKAKKEKEGRTISLQDLSPLAQPLARKKLPKKLYKTIKKASKSRQVKRGVKEVVKGIRKGEKGLLVLAADINPIDIISHLPILFEEAQIPYVFVTSKEELGQASSTKRPTSCVMVCPNSPRKPPKKDEKVTEKEDYRELYDECLAEIQGMVAKVVF